MGISLIIVNYNTPEDTEVCAHSFLLSLQQNNIEGEVIVVDNQSTDNSRDKLAKLDNVRLLVAERNNGYGGALNAGVAIAKYEYVLLSNSDIVFPEGFCEGALSLVGSVDQRHNTCFGFRLLDASGRPQKSSFKEPSMTEFFVEYFLPHIDSYKDPDTISKVDGVIGALIFVSREFFNYLGGFDDYFFLYSEEMDFCKRARLAGGHVFFLPGISVTHIGSRSIGTSSRFSLAELHRSRIKYFAKHRGRASAVLLWLLTIMSFPMDFIKSLVKLVVTRETTEGLRFRLIAYLDVAKAYSLISYPRTHYKRDM